MSMLYTFINGVTPLLLDIAFLNYYFSQFGRNRLSFYRYKKGDLNSYNTRNQLLFPIKKKHVKKLLSPEFENFLIDNFPTVFQPENLNQNTFIKKARNSILYFYGLLPQNISLIFSEFLGIENTGTFLDADLMASYVLDAFRRVNPWYGIMNKFWKEHKRWLNLPEHFFTELCYRFEKPQQFMLNFIATYWPEDFIKYDFVNYDFEKAAFQTEQSFLECFLQNKISEPESFNNFQKYLCKYSSKFEESDLSSDLPLFCEAILKNCSEEQFW